MSQQSFNNKILTEPQAASKFTVGIAPRANPLATGRVIVLGESEGGEPGKVIWFEDKQGAKEVLRGGAALKAIGLIFNPSTLYDGAPYVGFVRTQATTQGVLNLTSMKIYSIDYGTWVNNIAVKVETGSTTGSQKYSIQYGEELEVFDNLGLAVTIQYTGASTAAKIEVTAQNAIKGTHGNTGVETTAFNFDMNLSAYNTISKVVKAIDALDDWTCTIFTGAPAGVGALSATYLNTLAATDAKTAAVNLKAYPHIEAYCLQTQSAFVTATVETSGSQPGTTTGFTFLSSGTAQSMTNNDISAALTLIEEENCQFVWIDSETLTQQVMVEEHCRNNKYFRGCVFGGASQSSKANSITNALSIAQSLNSPYAGVVACGIKELKEDGSGIETLSPKFFAAKVIGLLAGQPVQQPITRKVFSCQGMQYEYSLMERENFIKGGVIAAKYIDGTGWVINQGVNTLLNNQNLWDGASNASPEWSLMRSSGQFTKELTVAADKTFIGGTTGIGRATIVGFVESFCKMKEADGTLAPDDSDPNNVLPAWENVVASRLSSGDGWSVKVSIRLNNPFNFFLIEAIAVL